MDYQWLVFQADLDPVAGHEQAGRRPVLVVSAEPLNDVYGVISVIPITSRKNNRLPRLGEVLLPAGTAGLWSDSFALCYQVRALQDATRWCLWNAESVGSTEGDSRHNQPLS